MRLSGVKYQALSGGLAFMKRTVAEERGLPLSSQFRGVNIGLWELNTPFGNRSDRSGKGEFLTLPCSQRLYVGLAVPSLGSPSILGRLVRAKPCLRVPTSSIKTRTSFASSPRKLSLLRRRDRQLWLQKRLRKLRNSLLWRLSRC